MEQPETFREFFRRRRKILKKTQEQVAEELGVRQTDVSGWETGRLPSAATHLLAIARWSGCSCERLLKMLAAEQEARR